MKMLKALIVCMGLSAWGDDWTLDNTASTLSFVTVKAGHVAEVHRFASLSGFASHVGKARIEIDVASLDTQIAIRDERMRELLFRTADFPSASIDADIDPNLFAAIEPGATEDVDLAGTLTLVGQSLEVPMALRVMRLTDQRVVVVPRRPILVQAGSLGLVAGVEQLREIAGLPSISNAVPVTFILTFTRI